MKEVKLNCSRCGGSGYIQRYSHVKSGVCFQCEGLGKEVVRMDKVNYTIHNLNLQIDKVVREIRKVEMEGKELVKEIEKQKIDFGIRANYSKTSGKWNEEVKKVLLSLYDWEEKEEKVVELRNNWKLLKSEWKNLVWQVEQLIA